MFSVSARFQTLSSYKRGTKSHFQADALFDSVRASFEEGNALGLFLNTLASVDDCSGLVLHSITSPPSTSRAGALNDLQPACSSHKGIFTSKRRQSVSNIPRILRPWHWQCTWPSTVQPLDWFYVWLACRQQQGNILSCFRNQLTNNYFYWRWILLKILNFLLNLAIDHEKLIVMNSPKSTFITFLIN